MKLLIRLQSERREQHLPLGKLTCLQLPSGLPSPGASAALVEMSRHRLRPRSAGGPGGGSALGAGRFITVRRLAYTNTRLQHKKKSFFSGTSKLSTPASELNTDTLGSEES